MPQPKPVEAARIPPCDLCGAVQTEKGALLFGPPNEAGLSKKSHVCVACYEGLVPPAPMTGAEFLDAIHEAAPEAFSDLDGPIE